MSHQWSSANVEQARAGNFTAPAWPHEPLVKLFSSQTHSGIIPVVGDLLEVGCMYGNNLRFLHARGHRCSGVEATADMVALAQSNIAALGLNAIPVQVGTNRSLPFPDCSFDTLVSVNTIHYDAGDDVLAGLREFRRVLRPGGVAFIETAGASHFVRAEAERIGPLRWKPKFGDFRDGAEYGMFDDLSHYADTLRSVFSSVETGRALEQYPKRTLDFYFAMCRR